MAEKKTYVVATDVGGTCTDTIIVASDGTITIGKVLSTPPEFARGVLDSVAAAAANAGITLTDLLGNATLFVHGSTVVDNTLLTGDGARTGLLTTAGFEDTLRVTRGAYGRWAGLPEQEVKHPVATDRAPPLVSFECTAGIGERIDYKGAVVEPLDEAGAVAAIRRLVDEQGVEAMAVALLWSFQNPAHEHRLRDLIAAHAPDCYVSLSSDIAPLPGEYERTSTTAINAYAGKVTRDYVADLKARLDANGYTGPMLIMQGYGGLLSAEEAAVRAVGMIECGPVAGLIGSRYLGETLEQPDIIAVDMGGTTSKVGMIQGGNIDYAREPMVGRYHYLAPKIEVVSIGAGGGSLITLEAGSNVPVVGPRSAGAIPGPVCYGRGGDIPTLTDVMLLVGYMHPDHFLDGSMTLDLAGCRSAFETQIAQPLGLAVEPAAVGICRIAASQMVDLIHEITVERGLDPRDFVLHAFGGTCAMLAGMFARELNVRRIVVPYTASVNCAFGLAAADVVHEYQAVEVMQMPVGAADLEARFAPMIDNARAVLAGEGFGADRISVECAVGMRYALQVHELIVPVPRDNGAGAIDVARVLEDFERQYEMRYGKGSAYRDAGVEITQLRVTGSGLMPRPVPRDNGAGAIDVARVLEDFERQYEMRYG
ncbi:MAG: hydantoinase/oxoprolinase family protein, partial [Gammaproteobacteria bacterium]|nr:hydantoinase/oxoprolinase family protein [Gammaproteobacteria bacterium]